MNDSAKKTIDLRASSERIALIDRAAAYLGKTRSEFTLDSACAAAENTLLDQRLFLAGESQYASFAECLDVPLEPTVSLKALLAAPSPWER